MSLKEEQMLTLKGQLSNAERQLSELLPTIPLQKSLTSNPEFAAKYARDNGLTVADIFDDSQSEFLEVLSLPIRQVAPANVPLNRVSTKRVLNVAIAIVLAGMIGVFVVFFRAYWKNN